MAVAVALYAGSPKLLTMVEEITRVLHDDDVSVAFSQAGIPDILYNCCKYRRLINLYCNFSSPPPFLSPVN